MINIIPEHNLNYQIPLHIHEIVDNFTAATLLYHEINNNQECILSIPEDQKNDGELIASLMRENNLKVTYCNGKIHSRRE